MQSADSAVSEYAPLVWAIARKVRRQLPPSFELEDLVQEGLMGLLQALERFDPGAGVSFSAFASFRIRGAMLDSVRRGEYTAAMHEELKENVAGHVDPILDRIELRQRTLMVAEAVKTLPERDRKVIEFRSTGMTMKEVGAKLGVKKVRAIQLHQRAVKRVQEKIAA